MPTHPTLEGLHAGQAIPFGGDRFTTVSAELAEAFVAGDRLVVVQSTGDLLHVRAAEHALVAEAVGAATHAFTALAAVADEQITAFYEAFATRLEDDQSFAPIAAANAADVHSAHEKQRSTTRLVLSDRMRADMAAGLRVWRDSSVGRDTIIEVVDHSGWTVTAQRAPLGVVGFVFEGRPNVFADATGVIRGGNTAVLRIGSDALGTARAITQHALQPALAECGLPSGAIQLIDSPARATGWALFGDTRLALAVARGSGQAVTQLGAVARQSGLPVSLHGTGGAWLCAGSTADAERFRLAVRHSLDRKVCNTLNVCCIVADRADDLVDVFVDAMATAASARGTSARLHVVEGSERYIGECDFDVVSISELARECEWENDPEVTLIVVESVDEAVALFNAHSPRLAASLISGDPHEHERFYDECNAPFIGNGFTRWVDGQFALDKPELGLSNWEGGRLFARSAVLSGDSVFTVRLRADIDEIDLHR